jgi:hypothetical protein
VNNFRDLEPKKHFNGVIDPTSDRVVPSRTIGLPACYFEPVITNATVTLEMMIKATIPSLLSLGLLLTAGGSSRTPGSVAEAERTPREARIEVLAGAHPARPLVKIEAYGFSPKQVSLSGPRSSIVSATLSASTACSYPGCLKAGDFAVVEIISATLGGSFEYDSPSQRWNVPLVLGDATTARLVVTVVEAAPLPKAFDFIVRITDVQRPNGDGTSTSIEASVEIDPPSGGMSRPLQVNP